MSRRAPQSEAKVPSARRKTARTPNAGLQVPPAANAAKSGLIIVESPTKARTLSKYLSGRFRIIASGGHLVDLPKNNLGVDIPNGFQPRFEILPDKRKTAAEIVKSARQAKGVYIATDPDREGEAIAWHIRNLIGARDGDGVKRIQFHEITKRAVEESLKQPGEVDEKKVDAQLARRIMDRLVGYQVSPLLWKTVTGGLSAGRVQSVALRLLCEREDAIRTFVPIEYWTIDGVFTAESVAPFKARLAKLAGKKADLPNKSAADSAVESLSKGVYWVTEVKQTTKRQSPYPPYTTSTLQQDAARRLGFPVKTTMAVAQQLYEGLELGAASATGLITYMRTDSVRVAEEAVEAARSFIRSAYGAKYLATSPRVFKNKRGAVQDAHEAIRPTDVGLKPEDVKPFLTPEQFKLYDLIWRRFLATQMKEAEFDVTAVTIADQSEDEFRVSGQVIRFAGYLSVYAETKSEENNEDGNGALPPGLVEGLGVKLESLDPRQHFTQPPPRYTEASLVKELDELGIGRPSTYATIISTLFERKYTTRQKRTLVPTELGQTVNRILVANFPHIFSVQFTAKMEDELDRVEEGIDWRDVMKDFYKPFQSALRQAEGKSRELKNGTFKPVGRTCPECGGELVERWGRRGRFISCSNFPKCKHAESLSEPAPVAEDVKCPKCGSAMKLREGKFGRFYGCSNYPKCRGVLPFTTGAACPKEGCTGSLVERRSKSGKIFYSCTRYPDCDFVSWNKPIAEPCPVCGAPTTFVKRSGGGENQRTCSRCKWKQEP